MLGDRPPPFWGCGSLASHRRRRHVWVSHWIGRTGKAKLGLLHMMARLRRAPLPVHPRHRPVQPVSRCGRPCYNRAAGGTAQLMALTRDRNDWDGVVLSDPPRAPGLRYPSDDDEPIAETEPQYHAITNAVFALQMHLRQLGRAATVRGKCALYYNTTQLTAYVTPDVLLAYGVAVPSEEGYAPWVYGKVPDLVMEMASPSTHAQDSGLKWDCYAALGIPEYWQHDPHHRYLTEDLLGWQLRDGVYVPIPLQPDPSRGAWIGQSVVLDTDWGLDMATGSLRLWNPAQGRWYPTVREIGDGSRSGSRTGAEGRGGPRAGSRTGKPGSFTGKPGSRTGAESRTGDRTAPSPAATAGTCPPGPLGLISILYSRDPVGCSSGRCLGDSRIRC